MNKVHAKSRHRRARPTIATNASAVGPAADTNKAEHVTHPGK